MKIFNLSVGFRWVPLERSYNANANSFSHMRSACTDLSATVENNFQVLQYCDERCLFSAREYILSTLLPLGDQVINVFQERSFCFMARTIFIR